MTRDEAANILDLKTRPEALADFVGPELAGIVHQAMIMGAEALRGPQPDPDTGLVPCGCGGKAKEETRIVEISGDYIARVFCEECGIATEYYSDGNVVFLDWNRAMGYADTLQG